ncbi:MAG: sigma-54 dependent transcriptional regulator, partial [candidate division WOR-3 bacterium]|nr:sigma-54 dependent transcriptional regulator [candidate division WOR-3 bacterium]
MNRLLLVEDEKVQRENLSEYLRENDYRVMTAEGVTDALSSIRNNVLDIVVSDIKLKDGNGRQILEYITSNAPDVIFIAVTAYASVEEGVKLIKNGAYDYISKPVNLDDLDNKIQRALSYSTVRKENVLLKNQIEQAGEIIYKSGEMKKIIELTDRVARSGAPVLISGESGTGKELIARRIHRRSDRADNIFMAVNSGALNENLLESELFGYEKGAFTGAGQKKAGRFETAHGGTIFLDEIGDISPAMQVKLLRVLQEGEFERVGGTKTIKTDVRVIAATNKDIDKLIENDMFREDLFYRLNVLNIHLPPLRARHEDIKALALYFMEQYSRENNKPVKSISEAAMDKLKAYSYPGNVRELQNIIQRAVILSENDELSREDFILLEPDSGQLPSNDLEQAVETLESRMISDALNKHGHSVSKAAQSL